MAGYGEGAEILQPGTQDGKRKRGPGSSGDKQCLLALPFARSHLALRQVLPAHPDYSESLKASLIQVQGHPPASRVCPRAQRRVRGHPCRLSCQERARPCRQQNSVSFGKTFTILPAHASSVGLGPITHLSPPFLSSEAVPAATPLSRKPSHSGSKDLVAGRQGQQALPGTECGDRSRDRAG